MADEISQVVEMEYRGTYYLIRGTKEMIRLIWNGIRFLHNAVHEHNLKKPGESTWQKLQEASEGNAVVLEFPKAMFEKTIVDPKTKDLPEEKQVMISPFELYTRENKLRYCVMPDLNPNDDWVPVGIVSQDISIHSNHMEPFVKALEEEKRTKAGKYSELIRKAEQETRDAKTPEEKEKAKAHLDILKEAKEENEASLKTLEAKKARGNVLPFEEYLMQGKGTKVTENPILAAKEAETCGVVHEFKPEESMIPIRDESLVPDSKEIYYSQHTKDNEFYTVKRTFEKDHEGVVFSEYQVTGPKGETLQVFSDRGFSREEWKKRVPEILRAAGMLGGQPTAAFTGREQLKMYMKMIDENFSRADEKSAEKEKAQREKPSENDVQKNARAAEIGQDASQKASYEESLYTTAKVPSASLLTDEDETVSLLTDEGLVSGIRVDAIEGDSAEVSIRSDRNYTVTRSDGKKEEISGRDVLSSLDGSRSRGAEEAETRTAHHGKGKK